MSEPIVPFSLGLQPKILESIGVATKFVRRLSDMKDFFSDSHAVEKTLSIEDPVIYEYWEAEYEGPGRGLSFSVTRIRPGTVGQEYYMTKGHFHTTDGDEVYLALQGHGIMLLQNREGEAQELEMVPGKLCYVPTTWAHRNVNTGSEDLVFLCIWPPKIESDYQIIARNGFPQLAVKGPDGPEIIENPSFGGS